MNKQEFKGLSKIFSFTLAQQLRAKGYKTTSLIFAIICFLLPACIIPIYESSTAKENASGATTTIETVYVIDNTTTEAIDFNMLNQAGNETFSNLSYVSCASVEEATEQAGDNEKAVLLALDQNKNSYKATLLSTKATDLESFEKDIFLDFISNNMSTIMIYKSGISYEALIEMTLPVTTNIYQGEKTPEVEDPLESLKEELCFALPYLNIMILYFMILFYGQNIANVVIMEKTSKLMDTFLVCVKPGAMIFGKVFASIVSCVLQLLLWILSLVAGFGVGLTITKQMLPGTTLSIIEIIDALNNLSGIFSLQGIILAIFMLILSFALYCSIAAVGGSLAGKPEDLGSANSLFAIILVGSFFALLYGNVIGSDLIAGLAWYDLLPFTASLITPSKMLLGYLTIPEILISYGAMLLGIFLFLYLAGRLYKLMSLYKGDFPKLNQVIKMLTAK